MTKKFIEFESSIATGDIFEEFPSIPENSHKNPTSVQGPE